MNNCRKNHSDNFNHITREHIREKELLRKVREFMLSKQFKPIPSLLQSVQWRGNKHYKLDVVTLDDLNTKTVNGKLIH